MHKITAFITDERAPPYHYKQHVLSGLGLVALFPAQWGIGFYNSVPREASSWMRVAHKTAALALQVILLPLTLFGMALKGVGEALTMRNYHPKLTEGEIPKTDPIQTSQIYEVLDRFSQVCKARGIHFFIDAGTALGAERHGGIIPWDDDGDVGLHVKEEEKLVAAKAAFEAAGLAINHPIEGVYQVRMKDSKEPEGYVDIFLYDWLTTDQGEKRLALSTASYRALFPKQYFVPSDFSSVPLTPEEIDQQLLNGTLLIEKPFGPQERKIVLPQLQNQRIAVIRYYGNDCMDFGIHTHHHTVLGLALPTLTKYRYEIVDKTPAPWIKLF